MMLGGGGCPLTDFEGEKPQAFLLYIMQFVHFNPFLLASSAYNLWQCCFSLLVHSGLRCVKPYYFTFSTHAKGRWVGRPLHNVLCQEFLSETPEYYVRELASTVLFLVLLTF